MKNIKFINTAILFAFASVSVCFTHQKPRKDFMIDSIRSTMDGYVNKFHYYSAKSAEKKPLIVSIHQWSADYTEIRNSLAEQTRDKGWNFIFPDIRGANNHYKACGSEYLIADIDQTIDWAIANLNVDTSQIYIVGASGGGYNALCHFMKSKYKIKEYSIWVPITDLNRWYFESLARKSKYVQDIMNCVCNNCDGYNKNDAISRSPLYWKTPVQKLKSTKLNIYAGIHDGYTGAVPITHSINFYNKIVADLGADINCLIPDDETIWMLGTRTSPSPMYKKIGTRDILYIKSYKNISISIFEGGHEILADEVIENLK